MIKVINNILKYKQSVNKIVINMGLHFSEGAFIISLFCVISAVINLKKTLAVKDIFNGKYGFFLPTALLLIIPSFFLSVFLTYLLYERAKEDNNLINELVNKVTELSKKAEEQIIQIDSRLGEQGNSVSKLGRDCLEKINILEKNFREKIDKEITEKYNELLGQINTFFKIKFKETENIEKQLQELHNFDSIIKESLQEVRSDISVLRDRHNNLMKLMSLDPELVAGKITNFYDDVKREFFSLYPSEQTTSDESSSVPKKSLLDKAKNFASNFVVPGGASEQFRSQLRCHLFTIGQQKSKFGLQRGKEFIEACRDPIKSLASIGVIVERLNIVNTNLNIAEESLKEKLIARAEYLNFLIEFTLIFLPVKATNVVDNNVDTSREQTSVVGDASSDSSNPLGEVERTSIEGVISSYSEDLNCDRKA